MSLGGGGGSGPSMILSHSLTLCSNREGSDARSWPPRAQLGTLIGWKVHVSDNRIQNIQAETLTTSSHPLWITILPQHAHCVGAERMAVISFARLQG